MATDLAPAAPRRANMPGYRVSLDGADLTDRIAPRLLSLSLTQKRGGEADELRLDLQDHDGRLAIPAKGAMLEVAIGWLQGASVPIGLVDMGSFKVDEAEHAGPPDRISVVARSADLTGNFRIRRDGSYRETTLGAVIGDIAKRQGLEPAIAGDLAAVPVPVLGQTGKSDVSLLEELGRRYDAVATVKAGRLIFSPIGRGKSVAGGAFGGVALTRQEADRHRFKLVDRDKYQGVTASWHDQDGAERKTEHAGATEKAKRLKRTFSSQADAKQAAAAEWSRIQRGAAECDLDLALGRAELKPEQRITLRGWKADIDSKAWLIAEVAHTIGGTGGFRTSLKLETAI